MLESGEWHYRNKNSLGWRDRKNFVKSVKAQLRKPSNRITVKSKIFTKIWMKKVSKLLQGSSYTWAKFDNTLFSSKHNKLKLLIKNEYPALLVK